MPAFIPDILVAQFSNGLLSEDVPAGYSVQAAPRRAARGRSGEVLFTALDLQTRTALPAAELNRLSHLMSQVYFETPGSVTAALRAAFVAANAEVLPFGQAPALTVSASAGMVQLHAVCSIFRDGDLYFGFAGDILALLLREGGLESYPAAGDSPTRALGTALNIDLRYGHSVLSAATTLLLAASPAPAWSAAVPAGLANLSLRALGERMAQQSASRPLSSGAILVRFSPEEIPEKNAPLSRRLSLFPQKKVSSGAAHPAVRKPSAPFVLKPASQKTSEGRRVPEKQTGSVISGTESTPVHPAFGRETHIPADHPPASSMINREAEEAVPPPQAVRRPIGRTEGAGDREEEPVWKKVAEAAPRPLPATQRGRAPVSPEIPSTQQTSAEPRLSAGMAVAAFGRSIKITVASALEGARSFLAGILPRGVLQENDRFTLPPAVLLGTAVAIPLIIVAVVAVMYFRKGYEMEFARLMQEARTEVSVANAQTDPLQARSAWQEAFDLLQKAARYGSSDELTTLQNHAARMLDSFDGITPLEFKPAVAGGFEEDTQITVLLAGDRELYALDGIHERVLRLLLGQGGYQLDETFICRAGQYPDITVDSLVDMVWVPDLAVGTQTPSSSRSGAVVAMDRQGTLLYCPPGGKAMAGKLAAPRNGWSTPVSIDYYNGRLYVLDPENNGFWRFAMSDGTGFDKPPSDYFSTDHPSVNDVVDFVVASGEVFFLHADGHITRCQYDPLFQADDGDSTGGTLCQDLPYNDTRPGRSAGAHIEDALLNRIYYNEPPEPTLFFLDPLGRGAYRFSLALNFISRYRVTIAPEKHEATALAVGADKVLYIAIGNQIYYAQTRTP